MITKRVAAALTVAGGVFYIIGGALGFGDLLAGILRIGLVAGPIIMIGGVLVSSKNRKVRTAGGALAIIGVILAGVYGCAGLMAGLILTLAGSISGFRYKESVPVQHMVPLKRVRDFA